MKIKNILIYAGSKKGVNPIYSEQVKKLARALYPHEFRIIFGAGSIGLMGDLADEYLALGGEIIGVIPQFMEKWEVHHNRLKECIWTNSMHERKDIMATKADAIIALPGGMGTLDELFEILTWKQLKLHNLPIAIFNINYFYKNLLEHIDVMEKEGFINRSDTQIIIEENPELLVKKLVNFPLRINDKYNHSELI